MITKLSIIFLLLFNLSGYSQLKKEWPLLATSFLAGGFEGMAEVLQHHYYDFNAVFPNANQQFWNASISWKNKYKNGDYTQGPKFPGSTTIFVWTTDGYHLMRMNRNVMMFTTFVFHPREKKKFKHYLLDGLMHGAAYSLGFNLIYGKSF
jgi:hypothetical protein